MNKSILNNKDKNGNFLPNQTYQGFIIFIVECLTVKTDIIWYYFLPATTALLPWN